MTVNSRNGIRSPWLARVVLAVALTFPCAGASASSRVALVIGNSAYETIPALPNTARDADAVRQVLEEAKFEVVHATNANLAGLRTNLESFARKAASASEVVVYFAGHAMQMNGSNYLMPVDLKPAETNIMGQALSLDEILKRLDATAAKTKIIILDACRNNPFVRSQNARGLAVTLLDDPSPNSTGSIDKAVASEAGLARVASKGGTIVAFSTSPGATAFDGGGQHSPYTAAFLKFVHQPGLPIEQLFRQVRSAVDDTTGGSQLPWETSSLTTSFSFFGEIGRAANRRDNGLSLEASAANGRPTYASLREGAPTQAYRTAILWNEPAIYRQFLEVYPNDEHALRVHRILAERQEEIAWATVVRSRASEDLRLFLTLYPNSAHAFEAHALAAGALSRRSDRIAALCPTPQRSISPFPPAPRVRLKKAGLVWPRQAPKPDRPSVKEARRPPAAATPIVPRRTIPRVELVDDDELDFLPPRVPVVLGPILRGPRPLPSRPYPGNDGPRPRIPHDPTGRGIDVPSRTGPTGGNIPSRLGTSSNGSAGPVGEFGRGGFGDGMGRFGRGGFGGGMGGFGRGGFGGGIGGFGRR
jgi:uncharacterized caspase-like protein